MSGIVKEARILDRELVGGGGGGGEGEGVTWCGVVCVHNTLGYFMLLHGCHRFLCLVRLVECLCCDTSNTQRQL